jgi:TolB-like protein/Tfp pilus assembly protein PilF
MQVGDTMGPALHLPEWANSLLAFFLILGFPIAMFFAWAFELTPEGLKREQDVDHQDSSRNLATQKLNRVIIIVMALALGYFALDKFVLSTPDPGQPELTTVESGSPEAQAETDISSKSIAVLPFVNMSSDPEQEYFSDGLTEELLNLLAGIEELKVAARTSSFFYKDKVETIPLTEIAKQLEVAHVLEGSVRKSGNTIRITAQLIKADDGFHLWSETYDRNLDDIFAIQDEIAAAVTDSLKITLLGEAPHSKVLNLQLALEKFERATELDPDNAAAWVGLSPLYSWLFNPPDRERSSEAARKAVELEPENPEAHIRYATALFGLGMRGELSRKHWNLAVELGQQNTLVLSILSGIEWTQGNIDNSLKLLKRAVALDPLHIVNRGNLSSNLISIGDLEAAEEHISKILELAPGSPVGLANLANIRLLQGQPDEALQLLDQLDDGIRSGDTGDRKLQYRAMIYHSQGRFDEADAALNKFIDAYAEFKNFDIAEIYTWRGEPDKAFEWLDRALEQDPYLWNELEYHPFLKGLHEDERWKVLLQRDPPPEFEF